MTKDDLKKAVCAILEPVLTSRCAVGIDIDGHLYAVVVRPSAQDVPRLIGRGGDNFQAVRKILEHVGERHGVSIRYFVSDPPANRAPAAPTPPDANFDPEPIRSVAKTILQLAKYEAAVVAVQREGRHIIAPAAALPYTFAQALDRWLNVCAKSQGGAVSLDAPSLAA